MNINIGIAVMVSLLVGIPSSAMAINGLDGSVTEAAIFNGVLVVALVLAYYLNRPIKNFIVRRFYNAKWLVSLLTITISAGFLAIVYAANLTSAALSFFVLITLLRYIAGRLWICPSCKVKLPYLIRGKPGFSIEGCPNCEAVLIQS